MDITVVFESMYGNTHAIADAIGDGIRATDPDARVTVVPASEVATENIARSDLVVVGTPTHAWSLPSRRTRDADMTKSGVREWIEGLPAMDGRHAATFDTRMSNPLSGGAARRIARRLRRHGYRISAKPQGFVVRGKEGPLRDGERDRAKAWGAALLRAS